MAFSHLPCNDSLLLVLCSTLPTWLSQPSPGKGCCLALRASPPALLGLCFHPAAWLLTGEESFEPSEGGGGWLAGKERNHLLERAGNGSDAGTGAGRNWTGTSRGGREP